MMHRPSRVVRLNGKGIAVKWQVVVCFFYFVTSTAQGLCVKVLEANLRSSPDPNSPITWTVGKFTPLVRLEKKGSWYKVEDQDGDQHWVSARFVTTQYQRLHHDQCPSQCFIYWCDKQPATQSNGT